jgi:hypothetical protein
MFSMMLGFTEISIGIIFDIFSKLYFKYSLHVRMGHWYILTSKSETRIFMPNSKVYTSRRKNYL